MITNRFSTPQNSFTIFYSINQIGPIKKNIEWSLPNDYAQKCLSIAIARFSSVDSKGVETPEEIAKSF